MQTIAERMQAISKLQELERVPWYVTRLGINISLHGDDICFSNEGDFVSLEEARTAIKYLAEQLGMEVKGGKTKKN